ncbi:MAG: redoxin domain-containing protein [Planctomycetes bacterium]|nr:redoxin domain-containing protein [Planctomycetota bacterium]
MRRLPFFLLVVCLFGLGCASTGKKPNAKNTSNDKERANDSYPFWSDTRPPKNAIGAENPVRENDGMLAGMLKDVSGKPQPNAVINVTTADAGPNAKPIGIQADDQGYFMIKGLKTGTTYFLSVRGDQGGRVLGGSAMTQAPNTRMLILLSEGNVSSVTPAPINPNATNPIAPDKKDGKTKLDPPTNSIPQPEPVEAPKDPLVGGTDWSPGKKSPLSKPLPPPPPTSNPNVADSNTNPFPPTVNIPGPMDTKQLPPPPPSSPSMSAVPSNSSPVGAPVRQVENRISFTVYDSARNPIEFQNLTDRRLIVLDFWTTKCTPCLQKIPDLIELQSRYSNYVEIAGIACDDLPWASRVKAVEGIKDYYLRKAARPINYRIYFEGDGQEGRLQTQFRVRAYPTMVLLDYTGRELWRGSDVRQLEESIKYYHARRYSEGIPSIGMECRVRIRQSRNPVAFTSRAVPLLLVAPATSCVVALPGCQVSCQIAHRSRETGSLYRFGVASFGPAHAGFGLGWPAYPRSQNTFDDREHRHHDRARHLREHAPRRYV